MTTDYGSRLRKARKHAGFTQEKLSEKTGIPQSTISTAERKGHGSGETPLYASACGVNPLWLATGQGEMLDSQGVLLIENLEELQPGKTTTAKFLKALSHLVDELHPTLKQSGRDVLAQWSGGTLEADSAAKTLDALAHVSYSLKLGDVNSLKKSG